MNKDKSADEVLDEAQVMDDDKKDQELPEAPTSATVRVWIRGFGTMLTVRDEKMNSLLKKVGTLVDYAESHGWQNTWEKTAPPIQPTTQNPNAPICPINATHGVMTFRSGISKKTGKPYSFWSCGQKDGSGFWCQGKK